MVSAVLNPMLALSACFASTAPAERPSPRAEPVWVYFVEDRPLPCDACPAEVSLRALERRCARRTLPGLVDRSDMPVSQSSLEAVTGSGAAIRTTSRWLNAASAWATPEQAKLLASDPRVLRVEPVRRGRRPALTPADRDTQAKAQADFYGAAAAQVDQIDLRRLHEAGFRGQGVVIGVLDTGFQLDHVAFASAEHPLQVIAQHDFVRGDGNTGKEPGDPSTQHQHGTWILGTMAAYQPGQIVGTAYEASFVLAKTENVASETPVEEDFYVAGLEFVESHGADIATSSLGYIDWYTQAQLDGLTAVCSIGVNHATANGLICLTSAGNNGNDTDPATSRLGAPADALQVIACGATSIAGMITSFSSDGPSADGRVKPELVACGSSTATVNADGTTGLRFLSGTSLSTPLVAGLTACVLAARPGLDVEGMRATLFATASNAVDGVARHDPLFRYGYGLPRGYLAALPVCGADLDRNGHVDAADLGALLVLFGGADLRGDLDGSGWVDAADLGTLLTAFGPCL
jgi:subtilisin family serine protease